MFLCFVDGSSPYDLVKKNHPKAQFSILHQPLHVSGVSRPIVRGYNRIYTTFGAYYCFR